MPGRLSAEEVFSEACEMPPAEREAYLEGTCGDDPALRSKVEALLEADAEAGSFLAGGAEGSDPDAALRKSTQHYAPTDPAGQRGQLIERYKLLEQIGEGGFGTVWVAEQKEPVKRRVALKIIKLGMDTKQVIARFEAERQALAMMDHPNIAKVLDAGATKTGRPYFVMEYVRGVGILEYCDTEKLDTRARLDLFIKVCQAIQHAHQKGIIHRDIKPSNVLITLHDGVPVPKVIDFGIAKATSAELTQKTIYTEHRQMIGTPAYMSPEQAEMSGLDIDTRSDVYSLGVLLYELLTGTTPFDSKSLRSAGFAEMMRIIREEEPHKPSTRLSTLGDTASRTAEQRRTQIGKLSVLLRGDLDWIVMKCLEKDRARRYETANGLAADIKRHLSDEPVVASPPSAAYRLRKFVKRNRVSVTAGSAIAAALILGVIVSTSLYVQAENARRQSAAERDRAAAAEQRASRVAEFLEEMIGYADPREIKRPNFTMRQALDEAANSIDTRLGDEPQIEAQVRMSIAKAYLHLGETDLAEEQIRKALAIRRKLFGEQDERVAASIQGLAAVYHDRSDYVESERLYRQALKIRRAVHGERHLKVAATLIELGDLKRHLGDLEAAAATAREAVDMATELAGEDDATTLRGRLILAVIYYDQGRHSDAEALDSRTLELYRRVLGPEDRNTLVIMSNLAQVYAEQGRLAEAESLQREVLKIRRRVFGEANIDTLFAMQALGELYIKQGRTNEAEELLTRSLKMHKRVLGEEHPQTLRNMVVLGDCYRQQGRADEAEALLTESLGGYRRVRGEGHPDTIWNMSMLKNLYLQEGKADKAEKLLTDLLEVQKRVVGDEASGTLSTTDQLVDLYQRSGRLDEAASMCATVLEVRERVLGEEAPATLHTMTTLGILYQQLERTKEAEELITQSLEGDRRVLGEEDGETVWAMRQLGDLYLQEGRTDEKTEEFLSQSLELHRRVFGEAHIDTLWATRALALLYLRKGRTDEVTEAFLRRSVELHRSVLGEAHAYTVQSVIQLCDLYQQLGRTDEEETLRDALLDASQSADADALTHIAWKLLTIEPAVLRDPRTALELALRANSLSNDQNLHCLGTLALAYHLTGDTAKAIETQERAISLIPEDSANPTRKRYEDRLRAYTEGLETHQVDAPADPDHR